MIIGVTGATGFIGQALVPALLHEGHQVRILSRDAARAEALFPGEAVALYAGGLESSAALDAFCAGCDRVVHLAALAHVNGTTAAMHQQSTVDGTTRLLSAMHKQGVHGLVYISSIKASLADGSSHYGRAKAAAEALVKVAAAEGMPSVILRPAVVYGPGMKGNLVNWMRRLKKGRAPRLPARVAGLRMISRRDLCRAIIISLQQVSTDAATWEVNDGRNYPLDKVELVLRRALNRPLPLLALPRPLWWLAGKAGDLIFTLTGRSVGFSSTSYRTLFIQDEREAADFPGLGQCETLESVLPAILRAMH